MDQEVIVRTTLDKIFVGLLGEFEDSLREFATSPALAIFDTGWVVLELSLVPTIFFPVSLASSSVVVLDNLGLLLPFLHNRKPPAINASGFS